MKSTKQGPESTRFQKGQSGNPGGLTAIEREARDAVRQLFAAVGAGGLRDEGVAAYRRCLEENNPAIVKDFMDRLLGKPKERLALEDAEGNVIDWSRSASLAEILEIVRSGK